MPIIYHSIFSNILKKTDNADDAKIKFSSCLMANVSHCEKSNLDRFTVVVYNPLSRYVNHYVRLPVNGNSYTIVGPDGNLLLSCFKELKLTKNIYYSQILLFQEMSIMKYFQRLLILVMLILLHHPRKN